MSFVRVVSKGGGGKRKTPGIHCYVAGLIPALTPRYSSTKIRNALWSTKKKERKKKCRGARQLTLSKGPE
jgi:hypothetical protein